MTRNVDPASPAAKAGGDGPDAEITPEMVQAGVDRLLELESQTGSEHVVREVYRVMRRLSRD